MESVETLIPDNEGNHLVVVLSFYDDSEKSGTFQIPKEFATIEITDESTDIIVGPNGYQTFARVFYRSKHAPIIHLAINHLRNKYADQQPHGLREAKLVVAGI